MKSISLFCVIFLLIFSQSAYSDNIRGPMQWISVVDTEADRSEEIIVSPEDLIAFKINSSENIPFRMQLEIRPSETLKEYPNTFALFVYNNIEPVPVNDVSSYNGSLVRYIVLPDKSRHFVDLFFTVKPSRNELLPGTDVLYPEEFKKIPFPFIMTVLPVMKGIPDTLLDEKIKIKLTIYYADKGDLSVNVYSKNDNSAENNPLSISDYSLFIDSKQYDKADGISLAAGVKKIRIEKDGYLPFEQSVVINKNEKNILNINLVKKLPQLFIYAPAEADIYIDGNLNTQKELNNLKEGEHTVVFKLGQYSLSRKFILENGKKYTINLLLDIEINENK